MSADRNETARKAAQWINFADEDLRLARHALKMRSSPPYRLIAYHAQQCAEKYLKAYLVYRCVDFPYTHSISRLLELSAEKAEWPKMLPDADELTPYAITTRYPGEDETVTKTEAIRAMEIASHVRTTVRTVLKREGLGF